MLCFRKKQRANSKKTYDQTEGQTEGWMEGQMEGWTERQTDPILWDPSGQGWGFNNKLIFN